MQIGMIACWHSDWHDDVYAWLKQHHFAWTFPVGELRSWDYVNAVGQLLVCGCRLEVHESCLTLHYDGPVKTLLAKARRLTGLK